MGYTHLTTDGWRESVVVSSLKWLRKQTCQSSRQDMNADGTDVAKKTKDCKRDLRRTPIHIAQQIHLEANQLLGYSV